MFRSCEIREKTKRKQPDRRIQRINEAKTSVAIARKTGQSLPPQGERISQKKMGNLIFMKIFLFCSQYAQLAFIWSYNYSKNIMFIESNTRFRL